MSVMRKLFGIGNPLGFGKKRTLTLSEVFGEPNPRGTWLKINGIPELKPTHKQRVERNRRHRESRQARCKS